MNQSNPAGKKFFYLGLIVVIALGCFLRFRPSLHRPLELDEIITAIDYTSFYNVEHRDEFKEWPRFSARRTAQGLALCVATWKGPHNQMVYEMAVSVTTFFAGFSEAVFRSPAAVASILASVLVMIWAWRWTGSALASILGGLLLLVHPYFDYYGQTGRGYSLTVALVVLHILVIDAIRERRKESLPILMGVVLLSYLVFINLISTVFMWLVPVCLALLLMPGKSDSPETGSSFLSLLLTSARRFWLWHAVLLGFLIAQFIGFRLMAVMQVQEKYGLSSGIVGVLRAFISYLFPNSWIAIAVLGLAGVLAMFRSKDRHWLAATFPFQVLLLAAYVVATKKLPYERTFGLMIALAVMGMIWLWRWASSLSRVPALAIKSVVTIVSLGIFSQSLMADLHRTIAPDATSFAAKVQDVIRKDGATAKNSLILLPHITAQEMKLYLPRDPGFYLPTDKNSQITLYLPCLVQTNTDVFRCQTYDRKKEEYWYWTLPDEWRQERTLQVSQFSVIKVPCTVTHPETTEAVIGPKPAVLFWISRDPYFNLGGYVTQMLKTQKAPWTIHATTHTFMSPQILMLFTSDAQERELAAQIARDLHSRSLGDLYLLEKN